MNRVNERAMPRFQDHISALIKEIPENMLRQTITNSRETWWHIRPTILADFLRRDSGPLGHKSVLGLKVTVNDRGLVCTVQSHALTRLMRLGLQMYTQGIGKYEFVETATQPQLRAYVPHAVFKETLCSVYGVAITYPLPTVSAFAKHLTASKTAKDRATRIRITRAYRIGQQNK